MDNNRIFQQENNFSGLIDYAGFKHIKMFALV